MNWLLKCGSSKYKQICMHCMHTGTPIFILFSFTCEKEMDRKIRIPEFGEKRRYTLASNSNSSNNARFSNKRWFTSAFFCRTKDKKKNAHSFDRCIHFNHNSFSLFDASSPSCFDLSVSHPEHSCRVPAHALHFTLLCARPSSDKKDICFAAHSLTGVKEILGKRHTPIYICQCIPTTSRDEEIVREEVQQMEMQWNESEFEICIFGFFFYFIRQYRYLFRTLYIHGLFTEFS